MTITVPDDKSSHETALELLKQLITLASGVLALSATFLENFWSDFFLLQIVLSVAWLLLMTSVVCGLQAISSMVQLLRKPDFAWSAEAVRSWAKASKWCFIVGLFLFASFALAAAVTSSKVDRNPSGPSIIINGR